MEISEILARCWSDGGNPPDGSSVRTGHKVKGEWAEGERLPANPIALGGYFSEGRNNFFSPVCRLPGGDKITSSLVLDLDTSEAVNAFDKLDISPFAIVFTGSGEYHRHAYIALDRIHPVEEIKPIFTAVNKYVGADSHMSGEYMRRWLGGFNHKNPPPAPVYFETTSTLNKYSLDALARKAGILTLSSEPLQKRRSILTGEPLDNFSRDIDPAFSGKLRRLLSRDYRLSRLFTGLTRVYPSTSEASFAFATALLWRGFERGEILKELLTWPLGIIASHRKQTQGALYDRACGIIKGADIELSKQGWTREKRLIWIHAEKNKWIADQKLWKLTGLSRPDYRRGLDSLIEAGRAEIKQGRYRAGKNTRRVVKLHSKNQLFAANDYE